MDCRTCQPTLIDLLHGELATDAAEEAHVHLQQCPSCRGAMDKLAYALRVADRVPVLEPPPAVSARLMQLAEDKARALAALRKLPARRPPGLWQQLIEFVGRFAMARQVGMATIMLLIVAVGLWSLPRLEREPSAAGGTVVNPDPTGEAAPSAGVQPAEPLDLQVDLRAGRIRSKEEESRMRASESQATAVMAEPPVPQAAAKADPARALDDLDAPALEGRARLAAASARTAAQRPASARAGSRPAQRAPGTELLQNAYRDSSGAPAASASGAGSDTAQAFPANQPKAKREVQPAAPAPPVAASRSTDALLEDRYEQEPKKSAAPGVSKPASELYALGTERARAGDPSGALQAFRGAHAQTTDADLRRKAQLGMARAISEMRGCSAALSSYQQVSDASPASTEAGEALIEVARCRTQRGEQALARSLLERAARIPQTARRAGSMLAALPPAPEAESRKGEAPPSEVEAEADAPAALEAAPR